MAVAQEGSFDARLRRLRKAAGLTQEELASRAGLSSDAVSRLERGQRKHPYPHTVRALADALNLSEGRDLPVLVGILGFIAPALFGLLPHGYSIVDNLIHLTAGVLSIAVAFLQGGATARAEQG